MLFFFKIRRSATWKIILLLLFALIFLQNALNFVLIFVLLHHVLGQIHHLSHIALPLLVQKSLLHFALLFLFQLLWLSEVFIALRFEFHPLFFDLLGLLLVFKFNASDHIITLFLHFALLFLFQLLWLSEVFIALRFEFHPLFFDLFGLLLVLKFNAFDNKITLFLHFLLEAPFFIFMTLHQFTNLLLLFALIFLQNSLNFVLIFVLLHHCLGHSHHLSHLGSVVVYLRD
jgi:hypothetical protein